MTNHKGPKAFMAAVKDKVDLKNAEAIAQPKAVFGVSVSVMDNGKIIVGHPDFMPGQNKNKQVAYVIRLLNDGITVMVDEHFLKEAGRIIRPV